MRTRKRTRHATTEHASAVHPAEEDGADSDEEGLQQNQSGLALAHSQHNIQASQLPEEDVIITEAKSKKKIKLSISTRDSVVCAVCGQTGHTAGFIGAVYVDCPVKPCYLCKKSGHTAATCPFRLDPTHNSTRSSLEPVEPSQLDH